MEQTMGNDGRFLEPPVRRAPIRGVGEGRVVIVAVMRLVGASAVAKTKFALIWTQEEGHP